MKMGAACGYFRSCRGTLFPLIFASLVLLAALYPLPAATPVQQWLQRYNGPGNYSDMPTAVAVDQSGNIFITGYSDNGYYDFATLAYSNAGIPLWTNRYSGPGNYDEAMAMALDRDGNVFVAGDSEASTVYPYNRDFAILKYSNSGMPLWTNRYNGTANDDDQPVAMAVDTNGNVFVTGYSYGPGSSKDYLTLSLSGTGTVRWANRYNGPANGVDSATAIAVDSSGNVLVTGTSAGSGTGPDFVTIKYSNLGVPLWTNRYAGAGTFDDEAAALAVDTSGTVFVTGFTGTGAKANSDYLTIAYTAAGIPVWTNFYSSGPGTGSDFPRKIAVAANTNVIVTGSAYNGSNADYLTIAYSSSGVPLWTNRYNGTGNGADDPTAMTCDANGNVFITGISFGTNAHPNYATIAYSNIGTLLWSARYIGPGNYDDRPTAIALDTTGSVIVTGGSWNTVGVWDYTTIKYAIPPSIPLEVQNVNNQLVLRWTNSAFNLQSAPAMTLDFTNIPGATSPYTNSTSGSQKYFRLILN